MLSAALGATGLLSVTGTNLIDSIVVSLTGGKVQVKEGARITGAFTPSAVKQIVINGLGGNDALQVMDNVGAPATVNGGEGDDFVRGGGGKDILNGGNGNDVLDGGINADVFNGGAGTDTADYSSRTNRLVVSLDGVANDGGALSIYLPSTEKDNVMPDVENVLGGAGIDTLVGNSQPNVLVGNGSNDHLYGGGGRDVLIGGSAVDFLNGDADEDLLIGSGTLYDTRIPFLRTLGYEWRRTDLTYAQRIARLKAGTGGVKIDSANVPTDLMTDQDTGGAGTDWFVGHWGDHLVDKAATETSTVLSSPIRFVSQQRTLTVASGSQSVTKSATSFAPYSATAELHRAGTNPAYPWSFDGLASQTSAITDPKLTVDGRALAVCTGDAEGTSSYNYIVTFYLDEPRSYVITVSRSSDTATAGDQSGDVLLTSLAAGAKPVLDYDFFSPLGVQNPTSFTKVGTLQPGLYKLQVTLNAHCNLVTAGGESNLGVAFLARPAGG